jgi:nitroreductase/NAD-dependent dihydropyrimidine dehydrogenase PreA subunit
MYLTISGVRQETCTTCGRCVSDCPQGLFVKVDGDVLFQDPTLRCIQCGHCIAICPENAVQYKSAEPVFEYPDLGQPERIVSAPALQAFLRSRRSIRRFKPTPVLEKDITAVLDAMRRAPTASNKESIHFTVITSAEGLLLIRDAVMRMFRLIKRLLSILRFLFPFGRKGKGILGDSLHRSLNRAITRFENGEDPATYKAPCLVILSSPAYGKQSGVDAGIALTHGMLAAQSLRLGTCLIGFAHEALARSKPLRKKAGIPPGLKVQGVMVMGYPAVGYLRAPMRKPLSSNRL